MLPKTPSQVELAAVYTAADLFFNPTKEDNYPTVNLEAQLCRTPVVTYPIGGSPETLWLEGGGVSRCLAEVVDICLGERWPTSDCQ